MSRYAVVLAFDVRVEREALELADSLGIKIFTAEIIYHLFDRFMEYREEREPDVSFAFRYFLFLFLGVQETEKGRVSQSVRFSVQTSHSTQLHIQFARSDRRGSLR